jgi:anti-anti-sigma regulatory factor
MNFEIVRSDDAMVLSLAGELLVADAGELKMTLMRVLDSGQRVAVDLAKITEVDLACLQLLCSAHRSSLARKQSLTLANPLPERFQRTLDDAGYSSHTGCAAQRGESCLWIEGGE